MCVICGFVGCGRYRICLPLRRLYPVYPSKYCHDSWGKKKITFYVAFHYVIWCSYKEGHAINHWKETEHCYSLELETQRVWDYAGDNYVHRLIQSKTDGKLVELNHHCLHNNDGCDDCTGYSDTLDNEVEYVNFIFKLLHYLSWFWSLFGLFVVIPS